MNKTTFTDDVLYLLCSRVLPELIVVNLPPAGISHLLGDMPLYNLEGRRGWPPLPPHRGPKEPGGHCLGGGAGRGTQVRLD